MLEQQKSALIDNTTLFHLVIHAHTGNKVVISVDDTKSLYTFSFHGKWFPANYKRFLSPPIKTL